MSVSKHLDRLLRATPALGLSLTTLALAARESSLPLVLSRYSALAAAALLTTALLAALAWWLALRGPNAREVIARMALLLLSLAACLYAAELGFRGLLLEPKIPDADAFDAVVARGWPRPVSEAKARGTLRILGLADSFGVAGGPRNYHYRLEQRLRAVGVAAEVVNLSISGLTPAEELTVLRRFGSRFAPDLVLHGFFAGNDFGRIEGDEPAHYRRLIVRKRSGLSALRPEHLTLLQFFDAFARVTHNAWKLRGEANAESATFAHDVYLWLVSRGLATYAREPEPEERWGATRADLEHIAAETAALGAAYVMVIHPDQVQVEAGLRREVLRRYGLDAERYAFDLPQSFLGEFCASRHLACLDLLPLFRERSGGSLYRLQDGHLNDRGNALAARAIERFLRTRPAVLGERVARNAVGAASP